MPELTIAASVFNLPPTVAVAGSAHGYRQALAAAGYEHMQYAPLLHNPHRRAAQSLVADGTITSLHQSFFRPNRPPSLNDRALGLVFPQVIESMAYIEDLEEHAPGGDLLPVVVHPNEQYLGNRPSSDIIHYPERRQSCLYGPLLHQPTAEVLDAWGILSNDGDKVAERMLEVQTARGFDGVALDLHHLATERGEDEKFKFTHDWLEKFVARLAAEGALAGPSEVQVSFQPGFGGNKLDLENFLNGHGQMTPHGKMLIAIAEELPRDQTRLRITTEVRKSAWRKVGRKWREGNQELLEAILASPVGP